MGKTFLRETSEFLQAKRRKKRWKKVVLPLSLIVILLTCSMLTYPAITMELDTICGINEHVHTPECYQRQLICGQDGGEAAAEKNETILDYQIAVHEHTDACMDANGQVICGQEAQITLGATPGGSVPLEEAAAYTMTVNYYVQEISDTLSFKLEHKDTFTLDEAKWYTTSENYPQLKGFTRISENDEVTDGTKGKKDEEGYFIDLYYARNQYDMVFTSNDGKEDIEYKIADGTGIYYEADISQAVPSSYIKGETQKEEASGEIFVFDGWYENEECTGDEYSFDEKTMPANNLHFYAKWTAYEQKLETYHVRYLDINGEIIQEDFNSYANQAEVTVLSMPEAYTIPDAYEFIGWMDENTQIIYTPDEVFKMEAAYTASIEEMQYYILKAQYTVVDTAYIQYDVNGGNGTLTDIGGMENEENIQSDIPFNSSLTLSRGEGFSKTGYKLLAWNMDANADGSDSYSETRYPLESTYVVGDEKSIILYAEWIPELNEVKQTSITLSKTDEIGEPLGGAEFKLERLENDSWVQVGDILSIDINGLTVENLIDGTYRLTEIKAPEAYFLLEIPLLFEITDNKVLEISNGDDNYDEDFDMDYMEINDTTIMIRNVADSSYVVPYLPSTGGTGSLPYTLSGILLVMIALMYGFVLRRRKKTA